MCIILEMGIILDQIFIICLNVSIPLESSVYPLQNQSVQKCLVVLFYDIWVV